MINHYDYHIAMRTKALTLSLATTGSLSLSASTSGYARSGGSFITDGFFVGMEVAGTGFGTAGNNDPKVITAVTASNLTCPGCTAETAASGRTLAVGLPALRGWENVAMSPVTGRPYVIEQYIPGPVSRETVGPLGELEVRPMYSLVVFTPANTGLAAAAKYADAITALFPPGLALTATNADILRVRGDVGPFRGQLAQHSPGWAFVPVTIPFRVRTTNSI